jgi:hypothetical protein
MEVAINAKYIDLLEIGNKVNVYNRDNDVSWNGRIVRVNARVDQASQTVKAYIQVEGEDLKEGIYLEAQLVAKAEKDAYEMPRKLLVNNESIYIFKDSIIDLIPVNPVYFTDKTVVVKGLKDGTSVLTRAVPGAYPGMKVKVYDENKASN